MKRLKFHINEKLAQDYNVKNITNNDFKKQNEILYKVYSSLQAINEKQNDTEVANIVKEIYSNYLFIFNNHKMNNQRLTSNADSLFDSLYKLFENSNAFTQTQFEQYFNSFIKDFNNLFNLIDLKIFGLQLDNQLTYNKNVKLYEE